MSERKTRGLRATSRAGQRAETGEGGGNEDGGDMEAEQNRLERMRKRAQQEEADKRMNELLAAKGVDFQEMPFEEKQQILAVLQLSETGYEEEENLRDMHKKQEVVIEMKKKRHCRTVKHEETGDDDDGPRVSTPQLIDIDSSESEEEKTADDCMKQASDKLPRKQHGESKPSEAGRKESVECTDTRPKLRSRLQSRQQKPGTGEVPDRNQNVVSKYKTQKRVVTSGDRSQKQRTITKDSIMVALELPNEPSGTGNGDEECQISSTSQNTEVEPWPQRLDLSRSHGSGTNTPSKDVHLIKSQQKSRTKDMKNATSKHTSLVKHVNLGNTIGKGEEKSTDDSSVLDLTLEEDEQEAPSQSVKLEAIVGMRADMQTNDGEIKADSSTSDCASTRLPHVSNKTSSGEETEDMETEITEVMESDHESNDSIIFPSKKEDYEPDGNVPVIDIQPLSVDSGQQLEEEETIDPNQDISSSPELFGSDPKTTKASTVAGDNEDDDETQEMSPPNSPLSQSPLVTSSQMQRHSFKLSSASAVSSTQSGPARERIDDAVSEGRSSETDDNDDMSTQPFACSPIIESRKRIEPQEMVTEKRQVKPATPEPACGQSRSVPKRSRSPDKHPDDPCPSKIKNLRRVIDKVYEYKPLFAPPGVNPVNYTEEILQYFEWHRQALHDVQSRLSCVIPYGEPVKTGRHRHNSLDVWRRGQKVHEEELEEIPVQQPSRRILALKARSESPIPSRSQGREVYGSYRRTRQQAHTEAQDFDDDFEVDENVGPIAKKSFYGKKSKKTKHDDIALNIPSIVNAPTLDDDELTQDYLPLMEESRMDSTGTPVSPSLVSKSKSRSVSRASSAISSRGATSPAPGGDGSQSMNQAASKREYDYPDDAPLRLSGQPTLEHDVSLESESDDASAGSKDDPSYVIDADSDTDRETDRSGFTTARSVRTRVPTPGMRRHQARTINVQGKEVQEDVLCQSLSTPTRKEPRLFESFELDSPPKDNAPLKRKLSKKSSVLLLQQGDACHVSSSDNETPLPRWSEFKQEAGETSSPQVQANLQSQQLLSLHSPELTDDEDPVDHTDNVATGTDAGDASSDADSKDPMEQHLALGAGLKVVTTVVSGVKKIINAVTHLDQNENGTRPAELKKHERDLAPQEDEVDVEELQRPDDTKQHASQQGNRELGEQPVGVQCPICSRFFGQTEIEQHANACLEALTGGGGAGPADGPPEGVAGGNEQAGEPAADPVERSPPAQPRQRGRGVASKQRQTGVKKVAAALVDVDSEDEAEPQPGTSGRRRERQGRKVKEERQQPEEMLSLEPIRREKRKLGRLARNASESPEALTKKSKVVEQATATEEAQPCFICQTLVPVSKFEEHVMACVDRMEQGAAAEPQNQTGGNQEPRATRARIATEVPPVEEERKPAVKLRRKRAPGNVPTESVQLQVSDDDLDVLENQPLNMEKRATYLADIKKKLENGPRSPCELLDSDSETSSGENSDDPRDRSSPPTSAQPFTLPFRPISAQSGAVLDYMNQFKKPRQNSRRSAGSTQKRGKKRKRKSKRKQPRKKAATGKLTSNGVKIKSEKF